VHAVPRDARPKLREFLRRIATGEHVEDVLELLAREVAEWVGAADEVVQLVDGDLLLRGDRDDLLRQHVQRVLDDLRLLDLAPSHALHDDGGLEEIGPEFRKDAALGGLVEAMAGTADSL
jgi:hypothetical protein